MSFEVYVQFFHEGRETIVSEAAVRGAFPGLVEVVDEDYWRLRFGQDDTTDLFLAPAANGAPGVHTLSFHRPGHDARLWSGIWQLLAMPGAVYFHPGSLALVLRDAAAVAHLPAALRDARGEAIVVAGPDALKPSEP
jgi:hypothetical protein